LPGWRPIAWDGNRGRLTSIARIHRLWRHLDRGVGVAGAADGPFHLRPLAIAAPRHARSDDFAGDGGNFPLPVAVHNEIGDLIEAFNRMVASIAEQRSGLNDTLSLLDSMLANAPIGLAFLIAAAALCA
jgi:hypothetical protein